MSSKYGSDWRLDVADGGFAHPESSGLSHEARGELVLAWRVTPSTVFAIGKGDVYSQTRWRFRIGLTGPIGPSGSAIDVHRRSDVGVGVVALVTHLSGNLADELVALGAQRIELRDTRRPRRGRGRPRCRLQVA